MKKHSREFLKKMKKFIAACFLVLVGILFILDSAAAEVVNRVMAVVGNQAVTEYDLARAMEMRGRLEKTSSKDPNFRQEVLDRLIDDELFSQLLSKSKIEVSEDDLARAISNVLQQNQMSIDQLKAEVQAKGMTYDEYKKQIEREIKKIKFINQVIGPQVKITDQDLRDFYQRNQARFRGSQQAHIAEIALPLSKVQSQAEMDRIGETALGITKEARGGANFALLAKEHSKGPNAESGGDLGMVNLKDLPSEVAQTIRGMKIGDVSNPMLIGEALVIVKLISLPEISSGDFDRMRDDIYSALYDQKIDETIKNYLAKERQKAFIEIH